ncbi:MAG: tetratricopeptide repeat protein [Phycisphaerales bacterium]|nr:tetratricopeptide repeat protein [Phycisphaerales bacterium]
MKKKLQAILSSALALAIALTPIGCTGSRSVGPYSAPKEVARNPLEAQRLTRQAAELMESDSARAEKLLREALTLDLYHGPAHNNLGVLHLNRGELYEAANEFEWARKLMPGHPDPRLNLALALERAGRVDEALAACDSALEVYPGHIATTEALARLQLRYRRTDDRTRGFLEEIAMRGETEQWREWARSKLALEDD